MFLTTSPRKLTKDLLKFYLYVEKIDFEVGPRQSKMAKKYFCGKLKNVFVGPARDFIFKLNDFSLDKLTGNNNPRPEKILYVEKNDLKFTKNWFFGYGILTTLRKSLFSTMNNENNYNKVYNVRNYSRFRVDWQ